MAKLKKANFTTAFIIAQVAHREQVRRGGEPYIKHLMRVAETFKDPLLRTVAILHDVLEDGTGCENWLNPAYLRRQGFSRKVIVPLIALTKKDGEDYGDYIRRCCKNPVALQVKLADMLDNLPTATPKQRAKYLTHLPILMEAIRSRNPSIYPR